MKQIFLFLISMGTLTTVFAQGRQESRDVILGQENRTVYGNDRNYGDRTVYNNNNRNSGYDARAREAQIRDINRNYDRQIRAIDKSRRLSSYEKNRQIRQLEWQRQEEIRSTNLRYSDRNRYNNGRRY
jgi:hypothetical protein